MMSDPSRKGAAEPFTKTFQAPAQDLIGGKLFAGRYRIIEELGRGGMGRVYKAHDTKLKRIVALKLLPPELTPLSDTKERFMREAQAAAALDHPHICTVYEFDEAEGRAFISMGYVEGRTLRKKIESGPLDLDEALRLAVQVAEGLREAHGKGVVHRDIKSANIMVTEPGQAKIMDFGLARVQGGALVTKEGMTLGTIAYMSPEQARGEEVDQRSDIWSFGVVLYEMLSGQLPFKGGHDQAVVYSILQARAQPVTDLRPGIPMSLGRVVGKALEKSLDERYQSIEEMLADLKSIAAGLEPEGIRAGRRREKPLSRKKTVLIASLAGLILVLAGAALFLLPGRAEAVKSIAVLPLENRSGDPEQEYFVEGMHEELITELSKIQALKVISRPSVMRYKNSGKSLPEIAKELNVQGIVSGSALKVGERVRISVQLIDVKTERNLWAEKYDREYRDILTLHGEVALGIAREIRIAVTPAEMTRLASARPLDPEAHELYLKGRYYWNKFSPEWAEKSISYYSRAIEKNPSYALAYASLAEAYVMMSTGFDVLPGKQIMPQARKAAMKALELDPTLADAHVSLGLVAACYDWDRQAAKACFEQALALDPNSVMAHLWIEMYLSLLEGRYEESLGHLRRAQELDPLNLFVKTRLGFVSYYKRDFDRAIGQFQEIIAFDPSSMFGHLGLMEVYGKKGLYAESLAEGEKLLKSGMRAVAVVGSLGAWCGFAGQKDKALELLSELKARSRQGYVSSFWIAAIYMGLGEADHAFEWLEKAFVERDGNLIYITAPAAFDQCGSDPRYQRLLDKMGLGDLWARVAAYKKTAKREG
jgi:serine/threonine protein kinase/Tfp pilus assembly protein PilF